MKPALYILAGIVGAFALGGFSVLSVMLAQWLFGDALGIPVWSLTLMALGGGLFGWLFYRLRNPKLKP